MKTRYLVGLLAAALYLFIVPAGATSDNATAGFGSLYYNGNIVRTVVPPSAFPKEGIDNFYKVTNGVDGQLGIASVAPGNPGYHGGQWKVYMVSFNTGATPAILTSEASVLAAEAADTVTVTRMASADFLCPVQP